MASAQGMKRYMTDFDPTTSERRQRGGRAAAITGPPRPRRNSAKPPTL